MQTVWKSAILATAVLALSLETPAIAQDDDGAEASALLRAIGMLPMKGEELSAVMAEAAKHPLVVNKIPFARKLLRGNARTSSACGVRTAKPLRSIARAISGGASMEALSIYMN